MHRLDIQGLRAVAVLVVIADHAGLRIFAGGYVGVDVFFVLSGYLITSLLIAEAERSGRISLSGFYARRARRILPAATVTLVATLVFAATMLSYLRWDRIVPDVAWSAAFLANFRFADLGTDYFAQGLAPSPVQHFWSLAVEEQFYLVWPPLLMLLIMLAKRRSRSTETAAADADVETGQTGQTGPAGPQVSWNRVATLVAVVSLASFAWAIYLVGQNQTAAYFSSPGRAWELGAGALLALTASRLESIPHRARVLLSGTGLVAIAVAVIGYDASTQFPGYAAALPVLGSVAVVAAGIGTDGVGLARVLMLRPMVWIGDLSYSWYLWHWPVLVLWKERNPGQVGWLETLLLVGISLALACASYYLVENPIRRNRRLAVGNWRALTLWPVALLVVGTAIFGSRAWAEHRLADRLDDNAQYLALRDQSVPIRAQLRLSLEQADAGSPVAFPLTDIDQVSELEDDLWNHTYRCNANRDRAATRICPVGDVAAERTIVVTGDSHMGQWLPAFDRLGRDEGYRVVPLIKFGCAPYDVAIRVVGRDYSECTDFRAWVREQIADLKPEILLVGSRGLQRNMAVPPEQREAAWSQGVTSALERWSGEMGSAGRVIVVGDVPAIAVDPIECVSDARATMATCTTPADRRTIRSDELTAAAAEEVAVPFVDVSDLACLRERCPAVAGGLMVYANPDHLSRAWVEHVTPEIRKRLDRALRAPEAR